MQAGRRWLGLALTIAVMLAFLGCQGSLARQDMCPGDPDVEVMELREEWTRAPYSGIYDDGGSACGGCSPSDIESKELIRRKAENLLFKYPRHVPTRLFAALLAYEANDPHRATEHLDTLFALQPVHPEAAVLRSRIALEEGNFVFAITFLEDQVALRPDQAELYEALASAYFVADRPQDALSALSTAEGLGAPRWRVVYNTGLIEEALVQTDKAVAHYRESLRHMPGWPPAKARLRGLEKGFPGAQTVAFPPPESR